MKKNKDSARKVIALSLCCWMLFVCVYGCGEKADIKSQNSIYGQSGQSKNDDLRKELGVPETFQDTWKSSTGLTVANVDAAVEFPDVSAVPIIEVAYREMTTENILAFADAAFEGKAYNPVTLDKTTYELVPYPLKDYVFNNEPAIFHGEETYYNEYYNDEFPLYTIMIDVSGRNTSLQFSRKHVENVDYNAPYADTPLQENGWAAGTSLSPKDARTYAEKLVHAFAPELECVNVSAAIGTEKWNMATDDDITVLDQQGYMFRFTRPYAGISTTYTLTDCTDDDNRSDNTNSYYESASVIISEYGLEWMQWNQIFEQTGVLNENAELLSFEDIADIASTILPLQYTGSERDGEGITIKINRITLGYTRVNMKEDPSRYMMVPVWDFFGSTEHNLINGEPSSLSYSLLTINAIDSTVIDRAYGY